MDLLRIDTEEEANSEQLNLRRPRDDILTQNAKCLLCSTGAMYPSSADKRPAPDLLLVIRVEDGCSS